MSSGKVGEQSVHITDNTGRGLPPVVALPHATAPVIHDAQHMQIESAKYVTVQQLAPFLVGMLRGLRLALYGAIGGLLIGLQMGSRDWSDLGWGALIGAASGFLGRTEEAFTMDTPKSTSVTTRTQQ